MWDRNVSQGDWIPVATGDKMTTKTWVILQVFPHKGYEEEEVAVYHNRGQALSALRGLIRERALMLSESVMPFYELRSR